jgi:hypothetical protein
MSHVEQAIQLQIQDITATKQAFSASLDNRTPDTLWWLVDNSEDIAYENRVKGSAILAVDQSVDGVNVSNIWSDWFNLQNAYFSQDQPITQPSGVNNLKTAIELYYRWRVPQYFNDIMAASGGQGVSPQYVFPYPDFNLYSYDGTTWTKGDGPVDPTMTGPGILGVIPVGTATAGSPVVTMMGVYPVLPSSPSVSPPPPPPPVALSVTVPATTQVGVPVAVGGVAGSAVNSASGSVTVTGTPATLGFAVGYPVVIAEHTIPLNPDTALPVWKSEVAVVVSITGSVLILGQQVPPGSTTTPTGGLRNSYTAPKVYPLFADLLETTPPTSSTADKLQIGFHPDWGGGFVDVTSIVHSQVEGQATAVEAEEATLDADDEGESDETLD